jgi:hypothetical protein
MKTPYEQIDFNVALQAPTTIGSMFPFKEKVENVEDLLDLEIRSNRKNQKNIMFANKSDTHNVVHSTGQNTSVSHIPRFSLYVFGNDLFNCF